MCFVGTHHTSDMAIIKKGVNILVVYTMDPIRVHVYTELFFMNYLQY